MFKTISASLLRQPAITASVLAVLLAGPILGLTERGRLIAVCERKIAAAEKAQETGKPASRAFAEAAEACEQAGRDSERAQATGAATRAKQVEEDQARAEKDAKFKAALGDALKHAGSETGASAAVASFQTALAFGELTPDQSKTYAKQLLALGNQRIGGGDWSAAIAPLEEARSRDPSLASAADAALTTAKQALRKAEIESAISRALEVAGGDLCSSPDDLKSAWATLRTIRKDDPQYSKAAKAAARLDKCRQSARKWLLDGLRTTMRAQRENWARKYEVGLLDEGLDVQVRLSGKLKDRVTIEFVLFNRAWAHKITDGGSMKADSFLDSLQKAGFKRVTFSDGFSESFYYDLDPVTEEQAIANGGLDEKFQLR